MMACNHASSYFCCARATSSSPRDRARNEVWAEVRAVRAHPADPCGSARILRERQCSDGGQEQHAFALLGLAFKPNTDDMRDAPSLAIVTALEDDRREVRAHDPVGMDQARAIA